MFVPDRESLIRAVTAGASAEIATIIATETQEAVCCDHVWKRRAAVTAEGPAMEWDCWAGGSPLVPADFVWPRTDHTDKALRFLVQVNLATLPLIGSWPNQPDSGWLVFFGEPGDHYEGTEGHQDRVTGAVRFIEADAEVVVPQPERCFVLSVGESGWSPPNWDSPLFAHLDMGNRGSEYPRAALKSVGVSHYRPLMLMGFANSVQWMPFSNVPEAAGHRQLAMHSTNDFVDYFAISEEDLAAQRFDRAIHEAQC